MQLNKYIYPIIMLSLAIGIIFLLISGCERQKKIDRLTQDLNDCRNAPVRVDTIWIHDTFHSPIVYHPVPVKVIEQLIPSNIEFEQLKKLYYTQKQYDSVASLKDAKIRWKAVVSRNNLDEISFPEWIVTRPEIKTTITVDTCIRKKPEYYPKNHIGIDINLSGSNLVRFPNLDGVFFWSIKDKWKLNAGLEYNTYHGELYGKFGIGIYLK